MNVIKRKNTPPTQFGRSSNGEGKFRFMLQIKLALVLLILFIQTGKIGWKA